MGRALAGATPSLPSLAAGGFLLPESSPTTGCSPAPGQDGVNSRHTICRSLDFYKVVRLHQTGSGLQQNKKELRLGMAKSENIQVL